MEREKKLVKHSSLKQIKKIYDPNSTHGNISDSPLHLKINFSICILPAILSHVLLVHLKSSSTEMCHVSSQTYTYAHTALPTKHFGSKCRLAWELLESIKGTQIQ